MRRHEEKKRGTGGSSRDWVRSKFMFGKKRKKKINASVGGSRSSVRVRLGFFVKLKGQKNEAKFITFNKCLAVRKANENLVC